MVESLKSGSVMAALSRNLFPVNGGPGSMLPMKFGNEEAGGRLGKGFCRLAAALAPPTSEAFNVNGGLGTSTEIPTKRRRVPDDPNPPRTTRDFYENTCPPPPTRGSGFTL